MKSTYFLYISFLLTFLSSSCKKFIQLDAPPTELIDESVFKADGTAQAVVSGIYLQMVLTNSFASGGNSSIGTFTGLSADELINYSSANNRKEFYTNALSTNNTSIKSIWEESYKYIYTANAILEGVTGSQTLSDPVKQQLTGEAKFLRAFNYFYLVNLFGGVPLVSSTDYRINKSLERSSVNEIYTQIILDLKDAKELLAEDYSYSAGERTRPNKWAATALLSRVYLFTEDWVNAEAEATSLIEKSDLFNLVATNNVFLANSAEAIWQLMPSGGYTLDGNIYILTSKPSSVSLSGYVYNAFENGDLRRINWIDSITVSGVTYYFAHKYRNKSNPDFSEYSMIFRLAEQFLIRAEARIQLDNIEDGIADLNVLRARARDLNPGDLPDLSGMLTKEEALQKVEQERVVEMFTEWGARWFDLKRTDKIDMVLQPIKSGWESTDVLYPIPITELVNDPNLTQNEGYN